MKVTSPQPLPLRTVHAPCNAYGSNIGRRPCEIRSDTAQPAHDTPLRILLAEQQVLSASPRPQHSHILDFVSHPNDKFSGPPQAGPLQPNVRRGHSPRVAVSCTPRSASEPSRSRIPNPRTRFAALLPRTRTPHRTARNAVSSSSKRTRKRPSNAACPDRLGRIGTYRPRSPTRSARG